MQNISNHSVNPIGVLRTCFSEKFGAPRQSGMIPSATGIILLNQNENYRTALNHLEKFSHIWVLFLFHKNLEKGWKPTVSPPRFQGPRKVGVFASRSPHRPNGIGMSALKLEKIVLDAPRGIEIHVSGVDILDNTPVIDIKPYLPFADHIAEANTGWTPEDAPKYAVSYSDIALEKISLKKIQFKNIEVLIREILERDPRPTSQRKGFPITSKKSEDMIFAFRIFDIDVKWTIKKQSIYVLDVINI